MLRATFLVFSLLSFCPSAPSQTTDSEKQTMQAVLSEIRQLRQDLQIAAVAARKVQIVIYRLHAQAAVVERASERLENARNEFSQMESRVKYQTEQIKRFEEMKDRAENEQHRKQFDDAISNFKVGLEEWGPEEQELRLKQVGLEAELRTEQAKWDRLQEELDRLENALENSALQASARR